MIAILLVYFVVYWNWGCVVFVKKKNNSIPSSFCREIGEKSISLRKSLMQIVWTGT